MVEHLDFELQVGQRTGLTYPVEVLRSPAGEAHEVMRLPFDEIVLENRLQALEIALLSSGVGRRRVAQGAEQAVQEFGAALFDALFVGEVRARFDLSVHDARQQGKGVRIKLRFDSAELASMPWEFLYDGRRGEYLCLSTNTPLVRYLELSQPIETLTVTPPLRILGLVSSPHDLPALDVQRERTRLEDATQALRAEGLLELVWLEGTTWRSLQKALRGGPWHVFHFVGHGGFDRANGEGLIALTDEEGSAHRLPARELGRLLGDHQALRLAMLNSCDGARADKLDVFSSTAATLVRRGVPAVVAMQYEISDRAAIELSRSFYEAVADGQAVDCALAEARKSLCMALPNTLEWGTPVLHMRSQNAVLFNLARRGHAPMPRSNLDPRPSRPAIEGIPPALPDHAIQARPSASSKAVDWGKRARDAWAVLARDSTKSDPDQSDPVRPGKSRPERRESGPTDAQRPDPHETRTPFCRRCGSKRSMEASFCNRCGMRFKE